MNTKNKILLTLLIAAMPLTFISCDKDDAEESESRPLSEKQTQLEKDLCNTSWQLTKNNVSPNCGVGSTLTFGGYTGIDNREGKPQYNLYGLGIGPNGENHEGTWWVSDGVLTTFIYPNDGQKAYDHDYIYAGTFTVGISHSEVSLTSSKLVLKDKVYEKTREYKKVMYVEPTSPTGGTGNNNSGNNNDNNGQGGEAPHVINFNYSSTTSTITVTFTATDRPTSASIKYGDSPSASKTLSTTIAGVQAKATATGLKKGTKYYFKCTLKKDGRTSTSDAFPAMTRY